jgi:PIN like domain
MPRSLDKKTRTQSNRASETSEREAHPPNESEINRKTKAAPSADVLKNHFPDAHALMTKRHPRFADAIASCDVVLDTNALLLPYTAAKESVVAIIGLFVTLTEKNRLFLPAQVAREFTKNRASKLGGMVKRISDFESKLGTSPEFLDIPCLSGTKEHESMKAAHKTYVDARNEYKKSLSAAKETIIEWEWDDPVFESYRKVFKNIKSVVELDIDNDSLGQTHATRYADKRPPGYKDASKEDGGIGDLIIWLTILHIGKKRKKDLVFVTSDEKADWYHRSDKRGFLPRAELVDEYRAASGGRSLYLTNLSRLLELFEEDEATVDNIREQEQLAVARRVFTDPPVEMIPCPHCSRGVPTPLSTAYGSSALPRCPFCGESFHAHRTKTGVITRSRYSATASKAKSEMEDWFFSNFKDPADGVPHDSGEGGYQFIFGGPYDCHEELYAKFEGNFSEELIKETADEIIGSYGHLWVGIDEY